MVDDVTMSDTERSYSGTIVAAVLLAMMVAGIAYRYWPSDERAIRRHLSNLAEALSVPLSESTEERLTRLAVLREYFDPDVRITFDSHEIVSRDGVITELRTFVPPPGGFGVEFVNVVVTLADDQESAAVTLTARLSTTDLDGVSRIDERVADVTMRKLDDDWVISTATLRPREVRALRRSDRIVAVLLDQFRDPDDFVLALDVNQLHALRGAANRPDVVGLGPENHALLGDEKEFVAFLDIGDTNDRAVAIGARDIDDADAAA